MRTTTIIVAMALLIGALHPIVPHASAAPMELLRLGGAVQSECEVRISQMSPFIDVTKGVTSLPIAQVDDRCNDSDGYRVVIHSANNGYLAGDGAQAGYTISYGALANAKLNTPQALTYRTAQPNWRSNTLSVNVPANKAAGDKPMLDDVIVTIEAP